MKIKFWCDSGANVYSCRQQTFELKTLGYSEEEWSELTDEEKQKEAEFWAYDRLDIGYQEIED